MKHDDATLQAICARVRARIVLMSHRGRAPHLGSSLSCVEALVAAIFVGANLDPAALDDLDRDRVILSKGHAAMALYATLAERGFFDSSILDSFNTDGAVLPEQPSPGCAPGVELATGSLGHGLPVAAGHALAAKARGSSARVFCVLSDGECNEGSVWEAAMFAPAKGLDNLLAVVDLNGWQATGRSRETLQLEPLADKWRAFGWSAHEIDGHDVGGVSQLMTRLPDKTGKPVAIVANTVKGKGVSFMEDDNNWHYRLPDAGEVVRAWSELGQGEPPLKKEEA